MALVGYNARRDELIQKMADIERQLGVGLKGGSAQISGKNAPIAEKRKRTMSAAGKNAIRAALKKRWAAFHAKSGNTPKLATQSTKKPKRKISPEAKARLIANLAKARAPKVVKRAA
jgi:hypothetical protein